MSRGTTLLLGGLPPATHQVKRPPQQGIPLGTGRYHPSSPAGLSAAGRRSPVYLGALSRAVTGAPERAYRLRASLRDAVRPAGSGASSRPLAAVLAPGRRLSGANRLLYYSPSPPLPSIDVYGRFYGSPIGKSSECISLVEMRSAARSTAPGRSPPPPPP